MKLAQKKLFLKRLNAEFFRENESFLSNPLLAIMMMMTFRENMDIPKRMNIFYDQAFSTLYQWHDATKAYTRDKILDIDEFQKSFGMFCLLSYYRQSYEFTHTEIVEYIKMSSKVCGFEYDPERILNDYEESVNLIRQDGLKYVFIHRSFQEYFAAFALVSIVPDKFHEFIPEISRRSTDNVLAMCFEMNKRIVVKNYISPRYSDLEKSGVFGKVNGSYNLLRIVNVVYNFTVAYEARPKRGRSRRGAIIGVSIDMRPDVTEFIENIIRLMGGKPSTSTYYTQEILFDNGFFDMFKPFKVLDGVFLRAGLAVNFDDNGPIARIELEPEVGVDTHLVLTKQIEEEVAAAAPHFTKVAQRVAGTMTDVRKWCEQEMAASEQRGRSLDEILGFSSA